MFTVKQVDDNVSVPGDNTILVQDSKDVFCTYCSVSLEASYFLVKEEQSRDQTEIISQGT